jgi:hypothetical protein
MEYPQGPDEILFRGSPEMPTEEVEIALIRSLDKLIPKNGFFDYMKLNYHGNQDQTNWMKYFVDQMGYLIWTGRSGIETLLK